MQQVAAGRDRSAKNDLLLFAGETGRLLLTMMSQIALVIFMIEAVIMVILTFFDLGQSPMVENLVDASSLTLTATPVIYFWVARPFVTNARDANRALVNQLEHTNALLQENERLNASLQTANRAIAEAHELLLQKIGAELHDGPAQQLTYVLLQVNRLAPVAAIARDRGIKVDLDKVRMILDETVQEVRAMSTGLSLPQLADADIEHVIGLAVRSHEALGGAKAHVTIGDLPPVAPLALKICVYRIVQEALSNARKHGNARMLSITANGRNALALAIADDGVGFDVTKSMSKGLGLNGMRSRIDALGGRLEIKSGPGQGTVVTATFPEPHAMRESVAA
jgi:signal transduction histidine kinase